jgi:pimeloyl-ACP methyl ester carboxylesterase
MPVLHANNAGPIEIYWQKSGQGEPVVLVGGLTSTLEAWGKQTPALEARHCVIAFDNRGSGRTRTPTDDGVRTPQRFAGDLLALLDGLHLARIHLVGASMGGLIVQEFALSYPSRLRSLTVCCSTFGGKNAVSAAPEVARAMIEGSRPDASPQALRAALEVLFHPDSVEGKPDAVKFYTETKRAFPHAAEEIACRVRGIASFDAFDALAHLSVPTLVLTGSHDRLVPPENSHRLAARIPGAELRVIEGGGHVFFVEQPEATNRALLDFFAKH